MDKTIVLIVAIMVLILGGTFYYQSKMSKTANGWLQLCAEDGGQVALTKVGFYSESYECFKDGQIINHID